MFIKKRLFYTCYKLLSKVNEIGSQVERDLELKNHTTSHSSVRLLIRGKIDNFARNRDLIHIGEKTVIKGQLLVFRHAGNIYIGKDCYIGEGSRIWSSASISIGNRVAISHGVNIHDTNSHSNHPHLRNQHIKQILESGHPENDDFDMVSSPIIVEDDVWLGFNSTILKGVKVGRGAIIAACSVVTKDIPSFCIAAGNPAKVIRYIDENHISGKDLILSDFTGGT